MSEVNEEKQNGEQYPDLYFDNIRVTTTVFGVNMTLALGNPHPENESEAKKQKKLATIRTSLEHAKLLAMLLRKQIKNYENNTGIEIKLPSEIFTGLNLDENDW